MDTKGEVPTRDFSTVSFLKSDPLLKMVFLGPDLEYW